MMRKVLLIVGFLLIGQGSIAHPIKMTTSKLSYDKKSGDFTLIINFFMDDFSAHLERIYHQRAISFSNPPDSEKGMVNVYVNKKLLVKINKKPVAAGLTSLKKIEDNVVQAAFTINAGKGTNVKFIEISNALLFDSFPEQVNILHLDLPWKTERNVLQFTQAESYKAINLRP